MCKFILIQLIRDARVKIRLEGNQEWNQRDQLGNIWSNLSKIYDGGLSLVVAKERDINRFELYFGGRAGWQIEYGDWGKERIQ